MKKIALWIAIPFITHFLFSCTKVDGDGIDTIIAQKSKVATDTSYRNPVWDFDISNATVFQSSGPYFAFGNEVAWSDGINILVPVLSSNDLMNWSLVPQMQAFNTKPQWETGELNSVTGLFSKSLSSYFLFYKLGDKNMGVASALTPQGPYKDLGEFVAPDSLGVTSINDPFVFASGSKFYLFFDDGTGIYTVQLTIKKDKKPIIKGNKIKIAQSGMTGVMVWKKEDYFYIFGTKDNQLVMGRAFDIEGPYTNKEGANLTSATPTPLLKSSGDFSEIIHIAGVQTDRDDNAWVLFNAIDSKIPMLVNGKKRQVLMLSPINMDKKGWPVDIMEAKGGYNTPMFKI